MDCLFVEKSESARYCGLIWKTKGNIENERESDIAKNGMWYVYYRIAEFVS